MIDTLFRLRRVGIIYVYTFIIYCGIVKVGTEL